MVIRAALFGIKPTRLVAWIFAALFAFALPGFAFADAVAGKTLFESGGVQGCSGSSCHGAAPGTSNPRILHAAKASAVISNAITNGMGGLVAANFSAQNLVDLADYIDTKITNPVNFGAVSYNPGGVGTPAAKAIVAPDFILPSAYNAFDRLTIVNANSATVSFTVTTSNGTYIAPVGQCSNATFTYRATGGNNTNSSVRTGNVTITNPAAPVASSSASTIAYSTSATAVPLTLSGTPTNSITITQQPSVGSVSASGATVSYTASNTAYTSPVTFKYRANGPCGTQSAEATVTLTVNSLPAPVITSAATANGTGGSAFSYVIAANNAPTSFNATGALPPGLTFNAGTATISGTPTAAGAYPITVSATNATGTGSQGLTITIGLIAPVVNSLGNANGTSGQAFSYQITATNLPASFGVTGALPPGVSVNTTTGLISGTPTVAVSTVFNVVVTATNSAGTGSRALAISISLNAPTVTSGGTASGTVGQAFSYQITGSDFPTSYAATGLPASLTLNTTTGLISGTPTVQGTINATVSASNGAGTSPLRSLVITITLLAPVISSGGSVSGTLGQALTYQITASGSPTSFSATGLPPGLSINTATGLISGTPTAIGNFAATVNAINVTGTGSRPVTFSIANVPLPNVNGLSVSTAFDTPTTINLGASVSGNFSSITITSQPSHGSVVLSGFSATYTPAPGFFGTDTFAFTATGTGGTTSPATVTITVGAPPVPVLAPVNITVAFNKPTVINLGAGISGVFTSITIVSGPTHGTVTLVGTTLTYTPNKGYFGTDSFIYTATGPGGTSLAATLTITVDTQAPAADGLSFILPLNTPTTIDLAPFISGSAISGIVVMTVPAHGVTSVNGTKVTYTPTTDFFGADSFTYAAFGNAGTSPPAAVKVTVTGRPDPTKQAAVTGLIAAQVETADRFAKAQISNFQSRMESMHQGGEASSAAKSNAKDSATGVASGAAPTNSFLDRSYASSAVSVPAGTRDVDPANFKSGGRPAADAFPFSSELVSLLASRSLNVASLAGSVAGNSGAANSGSAAAPRPNFWMAGTANFGLRQANSQRSALDFSTSGISLGVDQRFSEQLLLGFGTGFARDKTQIGNDGSESRANGYSGVAYASYQPGPRTFIDGLIGVGSLDFKSRRYVSVMDAIASGNRRGTQIFGSVAAGYEYRNNGVLLSPYGRLDYSSNKLKDSSETGAGQYALTFFGQTTPSLQGVAGFRAETINNTSFGTATPRVRLEYRHEFQGSSDASVGYADLASGPRFGIYTGSVARNGLALGFGADFVRREGLKIALDYELLHSFNRDTNQSIRLNVTQDLDGRGGPFSWVPSKPNDIQVDAGYVFDGNVTRAKESSNKRSDRSTSLNAGRALVYTFDRFPNIRALVTYSAGGEKFQNYDGLSRASAGLQGELQYRPSSEFDAATFSLTAQSSGEYFQSVLRRGFRSSIAGSVRVPITDRVNVSAALAHNERDARSDVFTSRDNALRFGVDYAFSATEAIYLNGEFRRGHFVSTGKASLENLSIADVFVVDDAFLGTGFLTYRTKGKTVLSTLGYNLGLGQRHSIDLSWRRVLSTPDFRPSFATSPRSYVVDQYSLVYLMRF